MSNWRDAGYQEEGWITVASGTGRWHYWHNGKLSEKWFRSAESAHDAYKIIKLLENKND